MLVTKLHKPSPGKNLVHRTNLFGKLNKGLKSKLILISAPAGFGKTTLLGDWIDQVKIPTAWFSLDKGDNDPVEFISYIIAGIQGIDGNFGQSAYGLLKAPNKPNTASISALLVNDIMQISQDFLLVLDDFHLINNSEIFDITSFLLDHIPDNIHIVISTRSDPTINMARLRSQHQMVEIRSSDLGFSANEISTLFNKKLKLGISTEDIYSLENKTEGWIAGLQLAAISLQGNANSSEFIKAFAGNNRYIMDYLIEEVLKIQSDDVKDFLLKTSLLKQLSSSLCNAVLDRTDSQIILEELEKNNTFVFPLDSERKWYRYHHLFSDLLKQRLFILDKNSVEIIHDKASDWFEQNNMINQAIDHALENSNYEKSISLLGKAIEKMWREVQHSAILKYGDVIPDEIIKKNPEFCLYYSWVLISAGQIEKAEPFLSSAEDIARKTAEQKIIPNEVTQHKNKLLGKISVAFAYLNSHKEHSDKISPYCEIALKNLSKEDPLWYSWTWFSFGMAHFSNGDLLESNKAYNTALEYGKKTGNIYLISTIVIRLAENEQQLGNYKSAYTTCTDLLALLKEKGYSEIAKKEWSFAALYFNIGITHFMWADLEKAYENIKIAYKLCTEGKDIYLNIFILMFYSYLLLMYDKKEAEKKIKELDDIINRNQIPPFLISMYLGWKIYVLMQTNQIDEANKIVAEHGLGLDDTKTHANEAAYSALARLLIAQNKLSDANKLLTELYALAIEGNRMERMIEIKISMAIMHNKKGNRDIAIADLMAAMEFASEENLISMFLYDVESILNLLNDIYKIQATTKTKISNEFIQNFKRFVDNRLKRTSNYSNSELSARELDTLKLIAEDLSNQEIADKLFISLNTVKTHLKNINIKLEVNNRSKAVRKARELSLI